MLNLAFNLIYDETVMRQSKTIITNSLNTVAMLQYLKMPIQGLGIYLEILFKALYGVIALFDGSEDFSA